MSAQPKQSIVLQNNIRYIKDHVISVGSLQWFADNLVEKRFIARRRSQGILNTSGLAPDHQASQLLDSVFTKFDVTDEKAQWYREFIDISKDEVFKDLIKKMKKEEVI
jgi:hypothetical protein